MSKSKGEGSHRYWNRLIRDHAKIGKDRTKSKQPPKRPQRGANRHD